MSLPLRDVFGAMHGAIGETSSTTAILRQPHGCSNSIDLGLKAPWSCERLLKQSNGVPARRGWRERVQLGRGRIARLKAVLVDFCCRCKTVKCYAMMLSGTACKILQPRCPASVLW